MMSSSLPLLLLALSTVLSTSAASYDGYTGITQQVKAPQKRAALVLDRLLVALQRALREGDGGGNGGGARGSRAVVGPRTAPLRVAGLVDADLMPVIAAGEAAPAPLREFRDIEGPRTASLRLAAADMDDLNTLQRRGPQTPRVRVIHCYFNAVTCF